MQIARDQTPWEEVMKLTMRPVIGGFTTLAVLGSAILAAIPLFGSRQPQTLAQSSNPAAIKSEVGRRHIVDARRDPYTAVGKFAGTVGCTAAIVLEPRVIITAGHCLTERDGSIRRSNLSFRLAYQAGSDLGRFDANVWAVGSKQNFARQSVHAASQDWAILILDRAPRGVQPFPVSQQSFLALRSREHQFLMPAYSDDIGSANVLNVDPTCSIRDLVWDVLIHDCTARYGSSGAPLLIRDGHRYAVAGIHTGSMFASDKDGHVAKFVGYRAIGSSMFADALLALARELRGETLQAGNLSRY
jgi:V8-like Glu-specific endopeptidase